VGELNVAAGNGRSFEKLDALIQRQHYRLAYWRVAVEEINYRRFFDVTEMVALKMELPEVFCETHRTVFQWIERGKVTGLRIDHPDGLWEPKQYLERLQKNGPLYVVVEKILCGDERLPRDWPADGTTGYDFLNRANGLFVDGRNADAFGQIYREFTGENSNFESIVCQSRKQVLERAFASELNSLVRRLKNLAAGTRDGWNFSIGQLRGALVGIIASFSVYRTYITEDAATVSEQDRAVVKTAIKVARERNDTNSESAVFDFIERLLLLDLAGLWDEAGARRAREFVMKFQQLTGPAMAKGFEDTAFYRFNRLVSLNEVGGDPGRFGVSPAEFHEANAAMAKHWPHGLLASATHDTKRGEDARARINVLSEMPEEWRKNIMRWPHMIRRKDARVGDVPPEIANDEYLFFQTLVGAWEAGSNGSNALIAFRERVQAFMLKAIKEAKVHTSWIDTNTGYEAAVGRFITLALQEMERDVDLGFLSFARHVAFFGRINSLAQTLLKITSPGVPDFYQGCELWDLNLVDPDNRRPVDYELRRKMLAELKRGFEGVADGGVEFFSKLLRDENSGAMKLFLIWRALNFRERQRDLFDSGEYIPLTAIGQRKEHVLAFGRKWRERLVVVIAPRLVFGLTGGAEVAAIGLEIWRDTLLPVPQVRAGGLFRNVLTREMVPVGENDGVPAVELGAALKSFPVAMLEMM
jgi:(1->4)-alpha-D-glucan 1-alpha-D-glucosylmutase